MFITWCETLMSTKRHKFEYGYKNDTNKKNEI